MAAIFVVGGDAGSSGRRARYQPMSDINVTPMVDVMLVLLVIFMVTAPLLTVGVPVDLPQTKAPAINEPKEPLVITVDAAGQDLSPEYRARQRRRARAQARRRSPAAIPTRRIYVRGDRVDQLRPHPRGDGAVSSAGFNKVSLVAELPQQRQAEAR